MGIFRRKKNEPQFADRDVVLGHTYEDEVLDAAVEAIAEADLTAAVTALADSQANPDVRSLRVHVLADKLVGKADSVHAAAHEHDNPELWLLAGTSYIAEAWAVRGDGLARTVGEDRFKMFRATLNKAVQPLHQAARLLPQDAVPWAELQTAGMGLRVSREEKDGLWREVISRCPTMYAAHARRLDILAKKWGGSNEEMLEFARGSADSAPAGDPLTAMVPLAHIEIGRSLTIEALDAGKKADFLDICGDQLVRARAEIDAAADKWMLAIPRPHPRALEAHNVFAAAYCLMGDDDRTRSHLVGMRDHVDEMPWGYFTSDAGLARRYLALYAQYVEKR